MRVTSVPFLIGVLVGAALLTTVWTASSLKPVDAQMLGFRPAALDIRRWKPTADASSIAPPAGRRYERVSERFLLQQLVRAYLADPWSTSSGTRREAPQHGWAFPSAADAPEEGEDDAGADDVEDEGVMLATSASVLTAQRIQELAPSVARFGEGTWQDGLAEDAEWDESGGGGESGWGNHDGWTGYNTDGESTADSADSADAWRGGDAPWRDVQPDDTVEARPDAGLPWKDAGEDTGEAETPALPAEANELDAKDADRDRAEGEDGSDSARDGDGVARDGVATAAPGSGEDTGEDESLEALLQRDLPPQLLPPYREEQPQLTRGWVASTGELVSIRYVGGRSAPGIGGMGEGSSESGESGEGGAIEDGPYLGLCSASTDWLCAAARSSRRRSARFHLLRLNSSGAVRGNGSAIDSSNSSGGNSSGSNGSIISGGNSSAGSGNSSSGSGNSNSSVGSGNSIVGSGNSSIGNSSVSGNSSNGIGNSSIGNSSIGVAGDIRGASSTSEVVWFALRSARNSKLVQMAPSGDAEAWVVRARGAPLQRRSDDTGRGWLEVGPFELWREDDGGLRNMGTGALVNFRGDADGSDDGGAVRGHADIKCARPDGAAVRCAARGPTRKTRFVLRSATARPGRTLPGLF